jgi:hypothetical protein
VDSFPHVAISGRTIALAWADGRDGLGNEKELVQLSRDGGSTWTRPVNVARQDDRPVMPGVALSPDARTLYTVYSADSPFQFRVDTGSRDFRGVLLSIPVSAIGDGTAATTVTEASSGDGRASSANALVDEFIGDYNQVAAIPTGGAIALYTSLADADVCDAIDRYRQGLVDQANGVPTSTPAKPAPLTDCTSPRFGNTQIKALRTP